MLGVGLILINGSNMEGADSNVCGHSDGPMTRARAKQLQSPEQVRLAQLKLR